MKKLYCVTFPFQDLCPLINDDDNYQVRVAAKGEVYVHKHTLQ